MTPIKAVLFDLDGTLLDTASDLGLALNRMRLDRSLPALAPAIIRPEAGRGCKGLLKLGFNAEPTDTNYLALCNELLNHYETHLLETTSLFPGMEEVLLHLEAKQIPWGIVTNKPTRFTSLLTANLNFHTRTPCIISGDTLPNCKPHPEPILHGCEILKVSPKECLYVGDSEVDIIASKAAGTFSLGALYGYIPATENPIAWQADGYINKPLDLLAWLEPNI